MNEFLTYLYDICKSIMRFLWEKSTSFVSNHHVVVILLIIYICFHGFWENFANNYIINNFLSTLEEGNIIIDTIFFITVLYCLINCIVLIAKKDNHAKRTNILQDTIILCFWIYYTCISKDYAFTSLSKLKNIYYVDIIPIYFFLKHFPFLWDRLTSFLLGNDELIISQKGFSRDIPIVDETEDFFDRDAIAVSEIEKIIETETLKDSFSYGLDASWGSGKTSFMNLMKDHILKQQPNTCVIMDFNPWLYSSEKNLVTLFFDELSKHLKPYDNTLADSIIDYSKALSTIASSSGELKFITEAFDLSHQSSTLQAKVSRIKNAILSIKKKIIVFVDDIDRLDENELMEMLKLIRNISDFPKMYFVVAYDKSYLINILKDKMANKELDFTEKIFQSEFHLPHCTTESLKDTLYNALKKHIDNDSDRKSIHNCIFNEERTLLSIGAITSLRDIKRLANSFYSSYSQLKGEVNARDLILLEVLKVKYPMVYSLIEDRRNEFLEKPDNNESFKLKVNTNNEYTIKKYLDSHKSLLSINDDNIIVIVSILEMLLPKSDKKGEEQEKSIKLIEYTNRYFNLSINEIPKRHFEEILRNNFEEIEPRFKQWFDMWPRSLTLRLEEYSPKSLSQQTNITKLFVHLVSEDKTSYFSNQAISNLLARFTLYATNRQIVPNAFKENGFSPNLCKYLLAISNDDAHHNLGHIISKEDANNIRYSYFSNSVQDPSCETWRVFDSFRGAVNFKGIDQKQVSYRDNDLELLKGFIENHFDDSIPFLFNLPNEISNNEQIEKTNIIIKEYSLNELPLLIWIKWQAFSVFISQIIDKYPNSEYMNEFLEFYTKFEDNYYQPTSFVFEKIKFDTLNNLNHYTDDKIVIVKTVKIFLGSFNELKIDCVEFADFIMRLNKHFELRNYNLQLKIWESRDSSYSNNLKQHVYNDMIRQSDIFLYMFHTNIGKYSNEELSVAITESKKRGLPMLVYFKDLKGKKEKTGLKDIKNTLNKEGVFWSEYDTNDKLHLDFALWLDSFLFGGTSELKVVNGEVTLGEVPVADMNQLSFATNNKVFKQLEERIKTLDKEIEQVRNDIEKSPENPDFPTTLSLKLIERNEILQEFERQQNALLGIAKQIVELRNQQVSKKLQDAIYAFKSGNIDVANNLLQELEKDGEQLIEVFNTKHEQMHEHIEALLLQAMTVMAETEKPIEERIKRITEIYATADNWAKRSAYDDKKYAQLLLDYAKFLLDYAFYHQAIDVCLRQIAMSEKLYGTDSKETATSYNEIGDLYNRIGNYSNAFEYLYKAIRTFERESEPYDLELATSYENLGVTNQRIGNYHMALEFHKKALEIREKVLGTEHPETAESYNNIGAVYYMQGEYDKALEFHFKALGIREKVLGKEHPDTATSYNEIGVVYDIQVNYDKALEFHKKALEIREKVLGTEHPETAESYNNIGSVYDSQGEYDKALKFYFKALDIDEKVLGKEHPETATDYNNIGGVYNSQGEYDKALEFNKKALEIREKVLGKEHPDTATSYNNIGWNYDSQGEYGKALEFYFKALDIREKVLGKEHASTATTYNNIGWVYREQGDNKKALEYYEKAYDIWRVKLGEKHPQTKDVAWSIEILKEKMKK